MKSDFPLVVFLDFDWVTHPDACEVDQLFISLPLIENVLHEFNSCRIVISCSWRTVHTLEEMREYFSPDIQDRVIGVTPEHHASRGDGASLLLPKYVRQWECEAWLRTTAPWLLRHRHVAAPWVAIDDIDHWFRPGCANLLRTNGATGFCADDVPRLAAMLKERLP